MLTSLLSSMIYALPISVICAAQLFPLFCPEDIGPAPWLIALVFLIVCALFRYGSLKIRLIIAAILISLCVGVFFAVDKEERFVFFSERSWVALVLLAALLSYTLGDLLSRLRWMRIPAAALSFCAAVFLLIREEDPGILTSAMLFTLILTTVTSEVEHYWKKEGGTDERRHMVGIIPFMILCAVLVLFTPSPAEPYDWPVAHRIWQFAKDTATRISQFFSSDEDYMDTPIGFSSTGASLHGSLSDDNAPEEMLTVSFNSKDTPALNLGACGYNEFNGRSWSSTADGKEIGLRHHLDPIEAQAALMVGGANTFLDHMRSIDVTVTYSGLNTRYALLPGKYYDISSRGALLETRQDRDNTVFADKRGLGTSYSFSSIMLNKKHKEFIELMSKTGRPVSPDEWNDTVTRVLRYRKNDYPYEEYLAYIGSVKANYLRDVHVSDALRARLDSLYEGSDGPYERMLRLEAVLSQFTYTTSPGAIPDYVDSPESFLDWFMLENPKGYCSHFATAMVLLARAEGLPARYVEGFHVPPSTQGGTKVTDHNAHAWAEIYFEGFGFIAFDPTPGYSPDSVWQTSSERAAYLSSLSKGSLEAFMNAIEAEEGSDVAEEPEIPEETSPALILIPALMCLILFPTALLLYRAIQKSRFGRLPDGLKAVRLCHSNMKLMRFLGARKEKNETLSEFAAREKAGVPEVLFGFISVYEELSYSNKPLTQDTLFSLMQSYRDLCAYASGKRRIAFFFYRLFAG